MIVKTPSITRMLSDLCYQVEENSHRDKQTLKEEIRNKKSEIKDYYAGSASTQGSQGTLACISGIAIPVVMVGAILAGNALTPNYITEATKDVFIKLLPDSCSQVSKGVDNNLNGRVTSLGGNAQIGQKEMELFQTRLQDAGTLDHKAQEILREAQDSERRAITG